MQKIKNFVKKATLPIMVFFLALPVKAVDWMESGLSEVDQEFDQGMFSGVDTIPEMIAVVIRILLMIGGAIAVLFVIIGGYQYLTSGGNEEDAEKGKKTLVNAIIGIVIILLAWVIVNVVVNQITD